MLFTFPSRYLFTIGQSVVLSLGEWSPHIQTGFLVSRPTQKHNAVYLYGAITLYSAPSHALLILHVVSFGWSDFARRYFQSLGWFPFLQVLRCFSSPRSLCNTMYSCCNDLTAGFPHSDIHGSMLIHSSPQLFAVYYVFLRLWLPRHPPNALTYRLILTILVFRSSLLLISLNEKSLLLPVILSNRFGVYFYTFLPRFFFDNTIFLHIILFSFFLIYNVL